MRSQLSSEDPPPGPRIESQDEVSRIDARSIRVALLALAGTDLAELDLAIDGGSVQIVGWVADPSDRDRVVRAVADVPGVIAVIDMIRIRTA